MKLLGVMAASALALGCKSATRGPAGPDNQGGAPAVATLARGDDANPVPRAGCVGWSATARAAACVIGWRNDHAAGESAVSLEWVGSDEVPAELTAAVTAAELDALDAQLVGGGYLAFTGAGTALDPGTPTFVGGVTVAWTRTETVALGENQPPTHRNLVTATCRDQTLAVSDTELEGDAPTVTARALGDRVLVEVVIGVAREGEYGTHAAAAVIDPTACTIVTAD